MTCDESRLLLHAYLDDELDAAQSVEMERHVAACPACAAAQREHERLRKALAQPELYRRAPDALRRQWEAPPAVAAVPRRRRPLALAAAAGFIGALLLSTPAWLWLARPDAAPATVVDEAISGHLRSLQPQHLMDVVSTDQHTVKPWFEGKLDFAPRVKELAEEGFPLAGGRLDAIGGRSVAALVYRRRMHAINLYQWPADGADTPQSIAQRHGYTVIDWRQGGMRFLAVSDLNEGELKQFALAFDNTPH
ncbi:zf-HC2 domain-containing protein [Dyella sp. LX-66]|uniref:anti-sigma factor family protein n=1 Tax=unclassified Dyella TaxID=2634549 RepID=UPI001BE041F8|nr:MULTISPECIES: zf-HC2 domain-containing protein [unclassified Dyella]MBT2119063.1 zf-HC2 domain-containing protein [Dyella sp. LX-1]MBT2140399.1 zf-HC2 domain-containing protein [Dyella sp. LX-66]